MELNVFCNEAYKRTENFRVAAGVIAILAAVYFGYRTILRIGPAATIAMIVATIAMIVFAAYAFVIYGRIQKPLLGTASIMLAIYGVLMSIHEIYSISSFLGRWGIGSGNEIYSALQALCRLNVITQMIISVIFSLIALKYFKKIKLNIKSLPIIAIVIILFANIMRPFIHPLLKANASDLILGFLQVISVIPFLLFIFFCPPTHKRVNLNAQNSRLQEQKMVMGDLNSQLQYLKTEFESGRITQQEYDYTRKSLLDNL